MSRDDIIRMAGEAGFKVGISVIDGRPFINDSSPVQGQNAASSGGYKPKMVQACLERFAALVAAHEREECARVCDDVSLQAVTTWKLAYQPQDQGREMGADDCAAAIRARGQT